jgi:hypothetical protein
MDELSMSLAYTNATLQLGPDGQRRNIFYSPSALVSLGFSVALDELYKTIRGPKDEKVAKGRAEVAGR